jgi:predicted signal transduction protein with EAL and GGDEF domain
VPEHHEQRAEQPGVLLRADPLPGRGQSDRRDFFRTLTIYALGYFLLAFYINTYQPQVPDGNWGDLLISGLFVLLAVLAGSHRRYPAVEVSRSLRRIVDAGVPLMLPLLLMMVALLVARLQPTLATVGFIGAMLGYALRSVLSQVEIQRQRDELETLARRDPLTGLGNRRSFDESLDRPTAARAARARAWRC